jgi:steroid 5-alpha reductase family enzyme
MISHEAFNIICLAWIFLALITFPVLLKVPQPYGRHAKDGWGPMINNRTGWILMELPALAVFGYFLSLNGDFTNKIIIVAALLWGMHYFNRVFIFPFLIRTTGKKIPVVIVILAVFFNTVNGFLNGYWLSYFANEDNPGILENMHLAAGLLLFLTGFAVNKYHDRLLINLRSSGGGYKIPFGGLFRFVSCPNFLGEIMTWAGFFLVTFSLPALSFLVWTSVNLTARALDHHKWYKREFPDYPKERKAILPFII